MSEVREVALFTGGGSGIGRAVSVQLAERGFRVAVADIDKSAAKEVASAIHDVGGQATPIVLDVSNRGEVQQVIEYVSKELGHIGVLVNNAGLLWGQSLDELDEPTVDRMLAVNIKSLLWTIQAIRGQWRNTQPGVIVNVASIAAFRGAPTNLVYSATKAAIVSLTKTLSTELAPEGIRVNAVAPGLVITPPLAALGEKCISWRTSRTPVKRAAEPDEIAEAICWLASDRASYVTGHVLVADGGSLASPY